MYQVAVARLVACLVVGATWILAGWDLAHAQKAGDVKITVTGVEKVAKKSNADLCVVNSSGGAIPMKVGSVALSLPDNGQQPLQAQKGTKRIVVQYYYWGAAATAGKFTMGWRYDRDKSKTIVVGASLRGSPATYTVTKKK